jgi:hypothetical protein
MSENQPGSLIRKCAAKVVLFGAKSPIETRNAGR